MPADDTSMNVAQRSSSSSAPSAHQNVRLNEVTDTAAAPAAPDLQQPARIVTITTGTGLAAGVLAFLGGAVAVGAAHYAGSTKALAEEGIDPRMRLRAIPMAFQALAVSTVVCGVLGVAGFVALHAGLPVRSESQVSSWQDAVAMARREREVVQAEFRARLSGEHRDRDQISKSRG